MKTIEERAKEYASKKGDISLSPVYNEALASIYEEGYTTGASEQKNVDIERTKNAFGKVCGWLSVFPWYNKVLEEFMKAVEE